MSLAGAPALKLIPKTDTPQTAKDFKSDQEVRWCPGCGDYAILAAVQGFMPQLGLRKENVVFISGIGCAARFPYYMNTYGMHSIHGRAPAIATGLASTRPDLSVWVVTGDGDALSIGGNHLIHALRRNVNLKILLFNNRIYGLTKGQYSPTSEVGKTDQVDAAGIAGHTVQPGVGGARCRGQFRGQDHRLRPGAPDVGAAGGGRAPRHSLVEIYQNCNIFNDGAFEPLKDATSKDEVTIRLEHGKPIRFGIGGHRGVIRDRARPAEVVDVDQVGEDALLVHDAHDQDPSTAFALSRLSTRRPWPTPRSASSGT